MLVTGAMTLACRWYLDGLELVDERSDVLMRPRIDRRFSGKTVSCEASNIIGTTRQSHFILMHCKHPVTHRGCPVKLAFHGADTDRHGHRHTRDDPREDVGVGVVECQLNRASKDVSKSESLLISLALEYHHHHHHHQHHRVVCP